MAWIIVESRALDMSEMTNNAQEFAYYFQELGYAPNVIAGMLGNIQSESSINPGRWESDLVGVISGGFGLVQWTPSTNYTDWAAANGYERTDPTGQMNWIDAVTGPSGQWIPTSEYPMSWEEFQTSTLDAGYLAEVFLYNFERPADPVGNKPIRHESAVYWYDNLDWSGGCVVTPRLTEEGIRDNPMWYADNPFYQAGYGMPNCTCYCWGRRYEITGNPPNTSLGNADTWFNYAVAQGQKTGREPQVGGIMCWSYTGSMAPVGGHVGIVEVVNEDGSIITSNSAYGGTFFYTQTLN